MAARLTEDDRTARDAAGRTGPGAGWGPHRVRHALLVASLLLLLLVGAARPNAAQPDLLPRGWAPGPLLPWEPAPGVVTAVLWSAYLLGAGAVVLGLRRGSPALRGWWVPAGLGAAALLTSPFGSADHVSYLAYGRILVGGGDPWVEQPASWRGGLDPVTSRVEAPWTEEPSVYGPAAELVFALSAGVGGDVLRQGVWGWQVVVVLAWLGTRAALRAALPPSAHGRVDVAWTLNPLVLGLGVLGAHVDVLATFLVVAAVAVVVRVAGHAGAGAAGAVVGVAASTKVTYAVGLVAVAVALRTLHPGLVRTVLGRGATALAAFAGTVLVLHLWAGPHVYDQLSRSRQAVSLATPWRPLLEALRPLVGDATARTVVSVGAVAVAVVLAGLVLRATRPVVPTGSVARGGGPRAAAAVGLWVLAGLELAYVLAAPYSLPWYDVTVWAALPAVAAGRLDLVALGRTTVAALAYVPGRVLGSTPAVEELTLGFRRSVAPWLALTVWAVVVAVSLGSGARRGSARAPGRPGGPRSGRARRRAARRGSPRPPGSRPRSR